MNVPKNNIPCLGIHSPFLGLERVGVDTLVSFDTILIRARYYFVSCGHGAASFERRNWPIDRLDSYGRAALYGFRKYLE